MTRDHRLETSSRKVLRWTTILGVSYFLLTILLLSLFTTDFSPVSQVASDYGIGPFALEMNAGFLLAGIGLICCAVTVFLRKLSRVASVLLFVEGLALGMDSYFTTNPEGGPPTLHGTIHGFGGAIFFFTAPVAMLLVSRRFGSRRFLISTLALIIGILSLILNAVLSLNAGGFAERIMIFAIFSWVIAISYLDNFSALSLSDRSMALNP